MFDERFFRSALPAQLKDAGGQPIVDVHLLNGQSHRARSVVEATDGYVVLEVYQRRAELAIRKEHWGEAAEGTNAGAQETHLASIAYESIAQVVVTPTEAERGGRIGFDLG
jgi:hypothetical protein